MRKSLMMAALLGVFAVPAAVMAEEAVADAAPAAAPAEPASPHTFTYNIGLYSQYVFRGLTQTAHRPALQGGADYSHSSGLYVGTWGSNINWLEDSGSWHSGSLEWDIYGGFRNTFGDTGIGYDVGLLNYIYPGTKTAAGQSTVTFSDPYTLEAYGALSWKWLQAKYSYAITDAFGAKNSDGTYYAELNANYPIGETGLTVTAHVGRQEYDGTVRAANFKNDKLSYTDYKLGLSKTWANGVVVGGYYTDTNARDSLYGNKAFGTTSNIGDGTFTAFVQKTF